VVLEWLILAEYLSSPTVFSEFRVVKCVSFLGSILLSKIVVSEVLQLISLKAIGELKCSGRISYSSSTRVTVKQAGSGATCLPADCCFSEIAL
jgi:hypothetical protein